ncbi:MAG TPA: LytTR family DNA-binding domain-containing protein [Flavisolibacter sp.]|jgi:two-component system LytT family response regulator|nr:LytTR family DNA-binding domain-containing protein [Flavisolibacter sp.]
MNIFIVEDEAIAAERIQELVRKTMPEARIVGLCDSIEDSVAFLQTHPMPDLVLMDIELVDGQSFEIFHEVEITCPVIFTTAYDEFALRAFKVNSIDYLLKPIQQEELQQSIEKFRKLSGKYNRHNSDFIKEVVKELQGAAKPVVEAYRERFLVKQGQRLISVSADEAAYFYSEGRVTFLKAKDERYYTLDLPLEDLEQQLDPDQFFRASRKYLVHRSAIHGVHAHLNGRYKVAVKPAIKDELFVSRDRAPEFKKWLGA